MFEIGEIVICCEDYKLPHTIEEIEKNMPNWVKKGQKYTIRGFNDNQGIVLGVLLEEVVNPVLYFKLIDTAQEGAFRTDRFRKLAEDEISAEKIEQENLIEI